MNHIRRLKVKLPTSAVTNMQKVFAATKAIIVKNNKFLIIKEIINEKTIWDLPGGEIEYGESPHETVKREVYEEIGLEVEITGLAGIYWFFKEADKKQVVCNTFLCKPKNTKIDLTKNPAKDENILEYKWITPDEFLKYYTLHIDKSFIGLIKNLNL